MRTVQPPRPTPLGIALIILLLVPVPAAAQGPAPGTSAPLALSGLSATLSAPDAVSLAWDPVADAVAYEVDVSVGGLGLGSAKIARLDAGTTAWEDLAAPAEAELTYRVTATGPDGPLAAAEVGIATGARVPDPVRVTIRPDGDLAGRAIVGPGGGELSVADASGVTYTLSVPPAALASDTELALVPAAATDGWPEDATMLGLVTIEPAGLTFAVPATLTMVVPGGVPDEPVLGFALSGEDGELGLVRPGPLERPDIAWIGGSGMPLRHTTAQAGEVAIELPVTLDEPVGALTIRGDKAAGLGRSRAPSNGAAAAEHKAAAAEAALPGLAGMAQRFVYDGMALAKATSRLDSCQTVNAHIGRWQVWRSRFQSSPSFTADAFDPVDRAVRDALTREITDMLEFVAENCDFEGVQPQIPCAESLLGRLGAGRGRPQSFDFGILANDIGSARLAELQKALDECRKVSYRVEETPGGPGTWKGRCFDSLTQPALSFTFTAPGSSARFKLRPESEGGGRIEVQTTSRIPGSSIRYKGKGRYVVRVTVTNPDGSPRLLDFAYTTKGTATACGGGACITYKLDADEAAIPIRVQRGSCAREDG
jgi:hypothetical protein